MWQSKIKPVLKRASKDKIVYKVLLESDGVLKSPTHAPKRKCRKWTLGVEYTTYISRPNYYGEPHQKFWDIKYGFRSHANIIDTGVDYRCHFNNESNLIIIPHTESTKIYECKIPKGSYYYINEFGEYMSDKLVVIKKVERIQMINKVKSVRYKHPQLGWIYLDYKVLSRTDSFMLNNNTIIDLSGFNFEPTLLSRNRYHIYLRDLPDNKMSIEIDHRSSSKSGTSNYSGILVRSTPNKYQWIKLEQNEEGNSK